MSTVGPPDGPFTPCRLGPGADLRASLHQRARERGVAGFVVVGIGSLRHARIRLAGAAQATHLDGPLEILSLAGSCTVDGAHLHISVSDALGRVTGGHVALGCEIATTAELLLADLPDWPLRRAPDAATGYDELVVAAASDGGCQQSAAVQPSAAEPPGTACPPTA